MKSDLFYFNGIGEDGDYAVSPMDATQLAEHYKGNKPTASYVQKRYMEQKQTQLDVVPWADHRCLEQTGWGVIFPKDADPRVIRKLKPLIDLRKEQAGAYFACFKGDHGYRNDESVDQWLARHGSGRGPVNPARVPYYLMIVGSPQEIPYDWQYQLDIQFAVGRINFPAIEDYGVYARTVCMAARGKLVRRREIGVFAPTHKGDHLCDLTQEGVAKPILKGVAEHHPGWSPRIHLGALANKAALTQLLGQSAPAFLFTAGHGFSCRRESAHKDPRQGGLVCSDWQGAGVPTSEHLFTANDITEPSTGLVAFFFGCYTSGSPDYNPFWRYPGQLRGDAGVTPIVASLPQALLSHPDGGALACIGHVAQAWVMSYQNLKKAPYPTHFQAAIHRLLSGYPVGAAMESFNQRHAESAAALTTELERLRYGATETPGHLVALWNTYLDARAYTIVGDPAVTLVIGGT